MKTFFETYDLVIGIVSLALIICAFANTLNLIFIRKLLEDIKYYAEKTYLENKTDKDS